MIVQFLRAENPLENTHTHALISRIVNNCFVQLTFTAKQNPKPLTIFLLCVCFHMAFVGCAMHLKMNVDAFNGLDARGVSPFVAVFCLETRVKSFLQMTLQ